MNYRWNRYHWLAGILSSALVTGCMVEDIEFAEHVDRSLAPLIGAEAADAVPGQYIVVFHEDTAVATVVAARNRVALAGDASGVIHAYSVIPGFAARLSPAALDALRRNPEVAYVEADRTFTPRTIHPAPSDGNDQTDQCAGADGLYDDHGLTGAGAHVYVIDSGARTTHTEFAGRVGNGFTAINDGRGLTDCLGHGTYVASLAVGTQYGMAKQAILHPVRVLNCQGSGTTSGVIAGVDFVRVNCPAQDGPCVANMSIGGGASSSLDSAVANAVASGVTFTVAAGDENQNACNVSPARAPSAITVAASRDNGCRAPFTNFGTCVDLHAPGETILGASHTSNTASQTRSGSSASSALAAGAAAMHVAANPAATPGQVKSAMLGAAVWTCNGTVKRLYNNFMNPILCP